MAINDSGLNNAAAQAAIENIISTDADVRLMTTAVNYDDDSSALSTKELGAGGYSAQTVAEADWSISHNVGNMLATLTNDNEINWGTATEDWGTVEDVIVHNSGSNQFIICAVDAFTIASGEEAFAPAGELTYDLGNPSA